MREFETGATRNNADNKLDYEAFLSPSVLKRFAEYMHTHRKQADGTLRAGDNWQKGIPIDVYMKSMTRHFMDLWQLHRGETVLNPDTGEVQTREELLCAILFNVQGMLHEELKNKKVKT